VTLPAEELTLEGFAEDGRADTMAPGPLLAMILGAVAGEIDYARTVKRRLPVTFAALGAGKLHPVKEQARRGATVRSFREESGNAGITGREMPSVEVLASMQHVEARARALREAGVEGTWEELKVRATLDLLQERDSRPAADAGPAVGANITITVPIPRWTAISGRPVR
jgi:hypothetical protein